MRKILLEGLPVAAIGTALAFVANALHHARAFMVQCHRTGGAAAHRLTNCIIASG